MEKPLNEWEDEKLIRQAKSLYIDIFVIECFATHDLLEFEAIEDEIEKRGYSISQRLVIKKSDNGEKDECAE